MKNLKVIIQNLYLLAIVALLSYWLYSNRVVLFDIYLSADAVYVLLSGTVWALAHFLSVLIVVSSFKFYLGGVSFLKIIGIHFSRLPHKYLPGGVWNTVARAADYSKLNFSAKDLAKYFIAENLLVIGVTFLLSGAVLAILYNEAIWRFVFSLAGSLGLILLVFAGLNSRLRVAKARPVKLLLPLIYLVLYWSLLSVSFLLFIKAFPSLELGVSDIKIMATFVFSWAVGFLAIFAPQGIGVSEYVTSQTLGGSLKFDQMVTFLVGFRIVCFLVDNISFSVFKLISVLKSRQENE